MGIFGQPKSVTQKVILKYYTMMIQENLRKLSNISQTPIFQEIVQAFENYDFFADPLVDSIYPINNVDSLIIQVVRNKLAQDSWDEWWKQELRYQPETTHLIDLAQKLSTYLRYEFPKTFWMKGHYVCLLPNGEQELHVDQPFWQKHAHRLVVPIITNPDAITQVAEDFVYMEPGQLYEMNVLRPHRSVNKGRSIRVHLFLDYVPIDRYRLLEEFYHSKEFREKHYPQSKQLQT